MNYRSVFLATTILIGEKSSTSCLIARHLDEKSRDCKQRISLSPTLLSFHSLSCRNDFYINVSLTSLSVTFQLHFAALTSLKSEITDLHKHVKKVTSERDSYRRTLKESRDEKDRLIVKYEERLHEQEQQVIAMWVVCESLIFVNL